MGHVFSMLFCQGVFIYLFIYWFIDLLIDLKKSTAGWTFCSWSLLNLPSANNSCSFASLITLTILFGLQHSNTAVAVGNHQAAISSQSAVGTNVCHCEACPGPGEVAWTTRNARQSTFLSVEYPFAYHCPPAMQICAGLPVLGSLLVWRRLKSESYTSMPKVDRLSASFQDVKQANGSNGKFGQWYVTTNASSQDFLDPIARWLVVSWQLQTLFLSEETAWRFLLCCGAKCHHLLKIMKQERDSKAWPSQIWLSKMVHIPNRHIINWWIIMVPTIIQIHEIE